MKASKPEAVGWPSGREKREVYSSMGGNHEEGRGRSPAPATTMGGKRRSNHRRMALFMREQESKRERMIGEEEEKEGLAE
ncbi:hypothetical protein E2542_SST07711 [Spatholobus suberectus]|nr:hypothetical protein E2542_SST07711 [Spatholobus suberectus]